jgi:glucosylceramidase
MLEAACKRAVYCSTSKKRCMKKERSLWSATAAGLLAALVLCQGLCGGESCEVWLTAPAGTARFEKQPGELTFSSRTNSLPSIEVNELESFQVMEGFGYTLTGGSAQHIMGMNAPARAALLRELFATDSTNIGVSYLRVSIGASDLNEHVFTYNDVPPGETDPELSRFSLGPDLADVVPVLRQIRGVFPELKILGSPWTAPVWMKTNGDFRGGSLKPECFSVYARYLVRYVEAMKAAGIPIDAITPQNEPLHPGNNPSMFMSASDQADFIKNHLGPAFKAAELATKIICYDHNADRPDYPLAILNDPQAKPFVAGSAFHLYAGSIEALSQVHDAHPDKGLYFTEQWIGAPGNLRGDLSWHTRNLIVGASRNWCRTVLEWNLAADAQNRPHTDRGGCDRCLGAITIQGEQVTRNPAYYIIAHASKFARPGSLRIGSSLPASLPNVAFRTPQGRRVLVVLNPGPTPQTFQIRHQGQSIVPTLPEGAVATYVW